MHDESTRLGDLFEAFIYAKEAQGRSPITLGEYGTYLRRFDNAEGGLTLAQLTPDRVNRYAANYRKRSPSAARLALAYLKSFASWLAESRYWSTPLGGSVLATVRLPRIRTHREPFGAEDTDLIFKALDTWTHRNALRDRAVVLLYMGTGVRLNELRELRISDVHMEKPLDRSWAFIRAGTSKTRTSRQVRISSYAANAIQQYLINERPSLQTDGPLIVTEEGEGYTRDGFQTYMTRLTKRFAAGGVVKWMAHRNRHWWATASHTAGLSVFDIQAEGGWRDVTMARRYTQNRPFEDLQAMPNALTSEVRRRRRG